MKKIPENPLILVRISGGLGNQMFQYATALALGKHWRCSVKVDIRHYDKNKTHEYQLDQYKLAPVIASEKDMAPFQNIFVSLQRRLHRFIPQYQPTHTLYRQPDFCFDVSLIKLRPSLFLRRGYFQSEKFFLPCAPMIRDAFQLKRPLTPRSQTLWEAIKVSAWPVALHVRRGNYLQPSIQKTHPLCTRAYYEKAANIINSRSGEKATYFVFSDDIDAARSMLSFIPDATFVTAHEDQPWVDMNLIATCRDAIIANSSFSWWGAWLNPHPDKHIIAPRRWFGSEAYIDSRDLIPSQWTSLDS